MSAERYTAAQIIEALKATKGMVYLAADKLGCSHQTVYNYIERYPTVKTEWDSQNGKMGDTAELKLYQAIINGEPWAVAFYLKTKGKTRGYVERSEVTGADGEAIETKASVSFDYSKLSTGEIENLIRLAELARTEEGTG